MLAAPSSSGDRAPEDVVGLLRRLAAEPRPLLTWYGPGDERVELTGRVLATWVAKTAHLLVEDADVAAGSQVSVRLGTDWRAPVFWLAARYLGAELVGGDALQTQAPDVAVVPAEPLLPGGGTALPPAGTVVAVPRPAVPAPLPGLPAGCVDYGAEVSGHPDQLPAPGPQAVLRPSAGPGRRVLLGPGAAPEAVLGTWAAGGSVVMHCGLDATALARVATQERTDD